MNWIKIWHKCRHNLDSNKEKADHSKPFPIKSNSIVRLPPGLHVSNPDHLSSPHHKLTRPNFSNKLGPLAQTKSTNNPIPTKVNESKTLVMHNHSQLLRNGVVTDSTSEPETSLIDQGECKKSGGVEVSGRRFAHPVETPRQIREHQEIYPHPITMKGRTPSSDIVSLQLRNKAVKILLVMGLQTWKSCKVKR